MNWAWAIYAAVAIAVTAIVLVMGWRMAPMNLERRALNAVIQLPDELKAEQLQEERSHLVVTVLSFAVVFATWFPISARWPRLPGATGLAMVVIGLCAALGFALTTWALHPRVARALVCHRRQWVTAFMSPWRVGAFVGLGVAPLVLITVRAASGHSVPQRQAWTALAAAGLAGITLLMVAGWARLPLGAATSTALGWADVRRSQELRTFVGLSAVGCFWAAWALGSSLAELRDFGGGVSFFFVYLTILALFVRSAAVSKPAELSRWRMLFGQSAMGAPPTAWTSVPRPWLRWLAGRRATAGQPLP